MISKLFSDNCLTLAVVSIFATVSPIVPTSTLKWSVSSPAIAQQPDKKTDSEYINSILPEAQRIEQEHGIPLDITLAIARLESGNGEHIVGENNHFGLRCISDDCVTIEKNGQAIEYETCPDASKCFDTFAESINEAVKDKPITAEKLYQSGYATGSAWVDKINTIRNSVQQTLSEAGIQY